ncbi:4'-phosphopantetheinyl transferase superfamily protein [Motilimonas cestriensis]|uniref:4'-phosphopantetheinyl transferase superfamily protein n=1 Tax=Motilimonas cestriensis TaxID=2742685 RepID=A0ABS8WHP7_9GAMM|nr:4'-phosphopantetheinyl transferase superfamily protein [Motilimonas cestriensis]MCE2597154.1 4'-phosphopantetheinyl transferase superfamily protein [Motilimonas cestriensis]
MSKYDLDRARVEVIYSDISKISEQAFMELSKIWCTAEEITELSQSKNPEKNNSRLLSRMLLRYALKLMHPKINHLHWHIENNAMGQAILQGRLDRLNNLVLPRFSFSYSYPYVAVAFHKALIGLDIEVHNKELDYLAIAENYYSMSEVALMNSLPKEDRQTFFYHLWTIKEASAKAIGSGLRMKLSDINVDHDPKDLLTEYGHVPVRIFDVKEVFDPKSGMKLRKRVPMREMYSQWFIIKPNVHFAITQDHANPISLEYVEWD